MPRITSTFQFINGPMDGDTRELGLPPNPKYFYVVRRGRLPHSLVILYGPKPPTPVPGDTKHVYRLDGNYYIYEGVS